MPRYEVEYTMKEKVIINASCEDEAAEQVRRMLEDYLVIPGEEYYSYGCKYVEGSNEQLITSIKELPDTALSMLLDKIRNQKQTNK